MLADPRIKSTTASSSRYSFGTPIGIEYHRIAFVDSSAQEATLHEQFFMFGQIAPGWKVIQPLPLTLERSDDLCIVSDDIFLVYGEGDRVQDALSDYAESLIDYYTILAGSVDQHPDNSHLVDELRSYLRPIR